MQVKAAGVSRKGRRSENQDSFRILERLQVFAVADGMGGLESGARVSRAAMGAVESNAPTLSRLATRAARSGVAGDRRALFGSLEDLFQKTGGHLYALAEDEGQRMGTTLTLAVVAGNQLTLGHVGDSRVYRVRGQQVDLLTSDHSVAALRYRRGTMSLEDYYDSPLRNVLYEFLGHDPEVGVDVIETDLVAGDHLVLCTDGVWDYLGNERLVALARHPDPAAAAEAFVDEALSLGSDDNCTAVVVHVQDVAESRRVFPARALATSRLFQGMHRTDLRLLAPYTSVREVPAGDRILHEGDVGEELFVIARGKIEVRRKGVALTRLGPRAHFGELSLVCDTPRSASVYAIDDTELVVLDRSGLNQLAERRADLANQVLMRILDWVGRRLMDMTDRAVRAESHLKLLRGD